MRYSSEIGLYAGISGAILMALHISLSPWAYLLYIASSLGWVSYSLQKNDVNLFLMNVIFTVINAIGFIRWIL